VGGVEVGYIGKVGGVEVGHKGLWDGKRWAIQEG
jgi:hypothetical protein